SQAAVGADEFRRQELCGSGTVYTRGQSTTRRAPSHRKSSRSIGPAYSIPAFWVPPCWVTHYVTFLLPLRPWTGEPYARQPGPLLPIANGSKTTRRGRLRNKLGSRDEDCKRQDHSAFDAIRSWRDTALELRR